MVTLITVIHIVTIFLLVLVVLLQKGKGAEISASFGGSSQTVFGSAGGANFFTRLTSGLAVVFMLTSLGLTLIQNDSKKSIFEGAPVPAAPATGTDAAPANAPAVPAGTTQN